MNQPTFEEFARKVEDMQNDLAANVIANAHEMNRQFAAGMRAGKQISRLACAALKVSYKNAQADQLVKLPTPLMCAIENILRMHEEQETNDYANAAIKRDKEVPQWLRELRTGAP